MFRGDRVHAKIEVTKTEVCIPPIQIPKIDETLSRIGLVEVLEENLPVGKEDQ